MANRAAKKGENGKQYEEEMKFFQRNVIGTQEAAKLLGVTQWHINLLIRKKKIEAKQLGPKYYAVFLPSLAEYQKTKPHRGKPPSNKPKLER